MLGADVMPLFRLLFAQMAASCAALAVALQEAASGKQVTAASPWQQPCTSQPLLVQRTWLMRVPELSATLLHGQKSFESFQILTPACTSDLPASHCVRMELGSLHSLQCVFHDGLRVQHDSSGALKHREHMRRRKRGCGCC